MKQRMFNFFIRILKNKYLVIVLTNLGYGVIKCAYAVCRKFLFGKSCLDIEKARNILNNVWEKPNMDYEIKNRKPSIDLSIIVPAYNSERTIRECIASVVNQKTKYNYELIIVNDGSTDGTQKIVQKISNEHIKLIHQENRGLSGARNRGIDECIGKYIMFLDSDDLLVGNCIEEMMDAIMNENADIVQGSYSTFSNAIDDGWNTVLQSKIIEKNDGKMVSNPGFPWAKIYKRELFEDIRFPVNVWFEDTIVCTILYRMCKKMVVKDDIVYAYRVNPEGICKTARYNKKCVDHYWIMEKVLKMAKDVGLPADETQYNLVSGHMSSLLYRRTSLMGKEVTESLFILACNMLDDIRPEGYIGKGNFISRDIERAFRTRNYKLWKLASFVV